MRRAVEVEVGELLAAPGRHAGEIRLHSRVGDRAVRRRRPWGGYRLPGRFDRRSIEVWARWD